MINIKYNKKGTKFLLINIGEAFMSGECLYIRTPYIKSAFKYTMGEYNALNLTNNNLAWVNDETLVDPVDLDITVMGGNHGFR